MGAERVEFVCPAELRVMMQDYCDAELVSLSEATRRAWADMLRRWKASGLKLYEKDTGT